MEKNWRSQKYTLNKRLGSRLLNRGKRKRLSSRFSRLKKVLGLFFALTIFLAAAEYLEIRVVQNMRLRIMDALVPAYEVAMVPYHAGQRYIQNIQDFFQGFSKIRTLERENAHLGGLVGEYQGSLHENWHLKNTLALRDARQSISSPEVNLRVISYPGTPYLNNILLQGGVSIGLSKDQPLRVAQGLVGRLIHVSDKVSQALLITDIHARVPVILSNGEQRGVLAGDNTPHPILDYVKANEVSLGQVIETSGKGGVFPIGIPVGTVHSIEDGIIRVRPFADLDHLVYVQAINVPAIPTDVLPKKQG